MFEYLYYILYILFGFEFILALGNIKYSKWSIRIKAAPVLLVAIAVGYLIFCIEDRSYFNFFFPIVSILFGIGVLFAVSEDDGFKGLFPLVSGIFFITISDTIGNSVYVYALHTWNDVRVIGPEVIFMLCVLVIVSRVIRPVYRKTLRFNNAGWAAMDAVLVVYEIMIYMMSVTNDFEDLIFIRMGIEFLALLIFIYASLLSGKSEERQRIEYEKRLLAWQVRANILQTEDMYENERRMSRVRHDIRHKLVVLQRCIDDKKYEDAAGIIRDIDMELEKTRGEVFCSNIYVNTVLSMYSSKCIKNGIKYSAVADVPQELPILITELSAVIAGMIEEAFRSVMNSVNPAEKFIRIQARSGTHSFILDIEYSGRGSDEKYDEKYTDILNMFERKYETITEVEELENSKRVKLLVNY